jgi:hypothetical protein
MKDKKLKWTKPKLEYLGGTQGILTIASCSPLGSGDASCSAVGSGATVICDTGDGRGVSCPSYTG